MFLHHPDRSWKLPFPAESGRLCSALDTSKPHVASAVFLTVAIDLVVLAGSSVVTPRVLHRKKGGGLEESGIQPVGLGLV